LMLDALVGNTGRLTTPQGARVVELADDTGDAMHSGAWLAATALLERFVARAAARLGATPQLVLTGGSATTLGRLIALPHPIDADVGLRGLAIYADNHS